LTRRLAIAALVVPALVLVAIAARSYQPFGGEPGGERAASTVFLDSLFTVVLVLGATMMLAVFWIRVRTKQPGQRGNPGVTGLTMFLIVIVTLVGVRQILEYDRRPPDAEGADPGFPQQLPPGEPVPEPELGRSPRVVWPLAIGIGGVIAAAIVFAVILERRRSRPDALTPEQLRELRAALDEAIEDLRRDPDPRRAVIAAYARMEQALTVYGLPRRPAEAPYEYLHRVGRELEAERPVTALTELFEVAKFSEHSVDETMRGRAIDALTAVRTEVRTAAT
jgi:Domain of unknown function (DUF4129)